MKTASQTVELGTGVTLQYVEQGDARGVPVVLLHGLSDSWHSYEPVLAELPASMRVFALSQRGHGDSTRPAQAYRYPDFAADVAGLLDARGIEAAVVVGHSMGSTIAQRYAIDFPARTMGLVLASSFHSLAKSPAARELLQVVAEMDDPVDPGFVREFQESTLAQAVPDDFLDTVVEESLKMPAAVWKAVLQCNMADDFSSDLDTIEAPTLLVWGGRDQMVPRQDQQELLQAIPNAQLVVYEEAGHAIHWERPRRFAADLETFVERVAG